MKLRSLAILFLSVLLPSGVQASSEAVHQLYGSKGRIVENAEGSPEASAVLPQDIGHISFQEAIAWQPLPEVVFVDARGEKAFLKGHIPGAVRVGQRTFDADYPAAEQRLRKAEKIVIYCTSLQCDDSELVATRLTCLGYKNLYLFEGGWAAWWKHHR